jgi:hypothetical protein
MKITISRIIGLFAISCNKMELPSINSTAVTPFTFYPTADAIWVFKWRQDAPFVGYPSYLYLDTLYLDKDSSFVTTTRTKVNGQWVSADPSMKTYQLIKGKGVTILPTGEKVHRSYRYTWFRQDSIEEKFYLAAYEEYYDAVNEYLKYDFGLEIGDTIPYQQGYTIISLIDSVPFGQHFLKRINHSHGWYEGSYIQGINLQRNYWNVGEPAGPPINSSSLEWVKFIHGSDTLVLHYQ